LTIKILKEDIADVLIEDYAEKLNIKAIKEVEKQDSFYDAFNEQEFVTTN
jgi:glycyl-tRNA synthetase